MGRTDRASIVISVGLMIDETLTQPVTLSVIMGPTLIVNMGTVMGGLSAQSTGNMGAVIEIIPPPVARQTHTIITGRICLFK